MLAKILGWAWIIMGVLFILKPQMLKQRLEKKGVKKLKKIFFGIAVVLGFLLITLAWKSEGLLSKIVLILGILSIIKGFLFLNSKAADKMIAWSAKQPLLYFRLAACIHITIGLMILLGIK